MEARNRAVVLLSGGIDSTTTLAIANSEKLEIYALSFDYNQRHKVELESAAAVAKHFNVKRHFIVRFDLRDIGGSALTADIEVPKNSGTEPVHTGLHTKKLSAPGSLPEFSSSGIIPVTYVPARNTIFLSFALAWAEVLETGNIFIGANAIDYSGYPDCRPEYLNAFEKMANLATKASIEGRILFAIKAPLISMTKPEIIKRGLELGVDYSLTWSCYDPQSNSGTSASSGLSELQSAYRPCGTCDSCRIRLKGFKDLGLQDPLGPW